MLYVIFILCNSMHYDFNSLQFYALRFFILCNSMHYTILIICSTMLYVILILCNSMHYDFNSLQFYALCDFNSLQFYALRFESTFGYKMCM